MKTIFLALCLCALSARSQTFVRYALTNFTGDGHGNLLANVLINVPTNTLLKATLQSDNGTQLSAYVQYPDVADSIFLGQSDGTHPLPTIALNPVLGPAVVNVGGYVPSANVMFDPNPTGICIAEFDTVNTTPSLVGYGVVPNGHTATIALQTSTNLITWLNATNGTYPATNSAKFYRLNLQVN
jgi:hypothetical protein